MEAKEQQRLTDLSNLKAKLGDMNRELVEKAQQKIQKHQEASRLLKDCNEVRAVLFLDIHYVTSL